MSDIDACLPNVGSIQHLDPANRLPPSAKNPATSDTTLRTGLPALHSKLNSIQAELENITAVITQLTASVARLESERETDAPTTITNIPDTSTTTTAPLPCPHPHHPWTTPCGRGAASPEVFQEIIKTNWHGRLGRTHMVDVDSLSATALTELDCLLRRKLHAIYPRGREKTTADSDTIFASLAALGLRLEDRGAYADLPVMGGNILRDLPTIRRGKNSVAWFTTHEKYLDYWQGLVLETLVELARYRGLFDDKGFLKEE